MPDPTILAAGVGAFSTAAGGLFGWLRGRAEASSSVSRAQSDQLATLAKIVDQQAVTLQSLMDRSERQSAKISSLSASLDKSRHECTDLKEVVSQLSYRLQGVEIQRDQLQADLSEAQLQIYNLQAQVEGLGHKPNLSSKLRPD